MWENGPVPVNGVEEMSKQEVVLEFRLSNPNAFECSACRRAGDRKLFPALLSTEELVVAFKEHVEREHTSFQRM